MALSTHRVEVVPVRLEEHPNADSLSIVRVFGYTVCVRTADWVGVDLGAYVPPDSIVPDTELFSFLGEHRRVKVKRLRGVVSQGLLVPAPEGSSVGDDVAEVLGVTHYEPPEPLSTGGEDAKPPRGFHPVYDVESFRRYGAMVFHPGEHVIVTEKIHGANARYCFYDGKMNAGSRTRWKRYAKDNIWWKALGATPEIEAFCRDYPGVTVYGEVYGQVQDLRYGTGPGEVRLAVFDLLDERGNWFAPKPARMIGKRLPWVPSVAERVPFDRRTIEEMAEGPSLVPGASHVREGVVVKPLVERWDDEVGRVCLKIVGNGYLERAK